MTESHLRLFIGDPFIRRSKIESLVRRLIPDHERYLNLLRFDGREMVCDELVRQARSFPMIGQKQVFLVRDFVKWRKEDVSFLEQYFLTPAHWSFFIFETDELRQDHAITKLASRYGETVVCLPEERKSAVSMIHEKLKSQNRKMTREAWELLSEKTGGDLSLLDMCVDQLMLYADENRVIDKNDVDKLAQEFFVYDSFDLTGAILEKNPAKAVKVFRFLYRLEGNSIGVIGLLNWQFKRIWQAKKILLKEGQEALRRKIKMPFSLYGRFVQQVSGFQWSDLQLAFDKLFELDWKVKTGALDDKVALESFIVEIATLRRGPRYLASDPCCPGVVVSKRSASNHDGEAERI